MSKISTAYDELSGVVASTLSDHVKVINPYLIDLNDDITFVKGYGLGFSTGENTQRLTKPKMSIRRTFEVTITRKIYIGNQMRSADSTTIRETAEKNLFEDQFLVIKAIEQDPTILDSNTIADARYTNDNGLEFVRPERPDLILIRTQFDIEYFEDLI